MNGEPEKMGTAEPTASANSPPPLAHEADRPVMTVNTDGVIKTTSEYTQRGFVDDPQEAVRAGDDLVAQVIKSLSDSFSEQRAELEGQMNQTEKSSTENRRLAFQRYRSFFERLLSI